VEAKGERLRQARAPAWDGDLDKLTDPPSVLLRADEVIQ
jgi:hypothetical protein